MNNRQHLQNILARKSDRSGFWHGHPHPDSMPAYRKYFAAEDDYALSRCLGDTFVWIMPEDRLCWQHPENIPMFDVMGGKVKHSL
ncbi:MAG: hypothetical protein SCM11_12295, partial [Bacillota bacterium]|nr:hypothetical protein [Bacillota bacterium]